MGVISAKAAYGLWLLAFALVTPALADTECSTADLLVTETPMPLRGASSIKMQFRLLEAQLSRPIDVAVIGDSLGQGWPPRLLQSLFPDKTLLQLATGSYRTQNVLWQLDNEALRNLFPSVVILIIGTNNLSNGDRPCAIADATVKIVEKIGKLWRKPTIYLIDIPPRGLDYKQKDIERRATNAFVSERLGSTENVHILNIDEIITCRFTEGCAHYLPDFLHISDPGYATITKFLSDTIMAEDSRK